jgi:hypothetical protein
VKSENTAFFPRSPNQQGQQAPHTAFHKYFDMINNYVVALRLLLHHPERVKNI